MIKTGISKYNGFVIEKTRGKKILHLQSPYHLLNGHIYYTQWRESLFSLQAQKTADITKKRRP